MRACSGTNRSITTSRIPKRGVSDAGVGTPFLAEGRSLSNPIVSQHIHVDLSVSQQKRGKEIMWLQTKEMSRGDAGPDTASSSLPNWWTMDSWHISLALNNQNISKTLLGRFGFV